MKTRSKEKEWMDLGASFYTAQEYADCLRILFRVNRMLGFFKSTIKILKQFPNDSSLIDVGCGGGLFLLNLSKYFPQMKLTGIDVSEAAIEIAKRQAKNNQDNPAFQLQPQMEPNLSKDSVDIVLVTLVCHHMDDEDLPGFLQNAWQAARKAVIINDLHRHVLAYSVYKMISPLLFRNRLITHDGLISIQRSFKRDELKNILKRANITHYEIKWGFPFRWRVILWKK
jgi:2-polyprenyl-3-methyl-5-hydroxy-6-metoxy-1,4-benzoquinol methylase